MHRAVVTGLGFITSIGNSRPEVSASLRAGRHGIEVFPEFEAIKAPVKLAGTIKGFDFPTPEFEDWKYPASHKIPRETLRIASYGLRISTMGYSNGWDGMRQDSRVKLRELYFC